MPTSEQTRLSAGDLAGFRKPVRDAMLHLANDCGIKYRLMDGNHVRFYPPDGESEPFKVSRSRPDKDSLRFIADFVAQHQIEPLEKTERLTRPGRPVPAPPRAAPAVSPTPPTPPTPTPPATVAAQEPDPQPEGDPWEPYKNKRGEETGWALQHVDTGAITCAVCQEMTVTPDHVSTLWGHYLGKHKPAEMTEDEVAEARQRQGETRSRNAAVRKLSEALETLGIPVGKDTEKLHAKIERLEADLAKAEERAKTAEARLALIKESLRA